MGRARIYSLMGINTLANTEMESHLAKEFTLGQTGATMKVNLKMV